jgi:hypothetical protein
MIKTQTIQSGQLLPRPRSGARGAMAQQIVRPGGRLCCGVRSLGAMYCAMVPAPFHANNPHFRIRYKRNETGESVMFECFQVLD